MNSSVAYVNVYVRDVNVMHGVRTGQVIDSVVLSRKLNRDIIVGFVAALLVIGADIHT